MTKEANVGLWPLATAVVEIRASAWVIVEASKIELLHVNFI